MNKMVDNIFGIFEKQAFGVCEWWGEKLSLDSSSIRLSFIYLSFITFGSPLLIYLIMAFFLRNKHWFKAKGTNTIWDL